MNMLKMSTGEETSLSLSLSLAAHQHVAPSETAPNQGIDEPEAKRAKTEGEPEVVLTPKARAIRLEQNRKAAKESRRRKKMMIEGT